MQINDTKYKDHDVFIELKLYSEFYDSLASSVFSFATRGTGAICNIDTYVYSSMQGTVDSINAILFEGRINDAYSLLRKYYDSVVINVYSNLYLQDNFSIENFIVEKINYWLHGKERLPEYKVMSQYIKSSRKLQEINEVFDFDDRYKKLRKRCNDHTHYNFYHYLMLNDNQVYIANRELWLSKFLEDIKDIFIMHMGYIFFLNDHYMMSGDYIDCLDAGMKPEEGSQYWVAPFVQGIFDRVITPRRPDVTSIIKAHSSMQLR